MSKSSKAEPPILANAEGARNCLGLNATVLPGLGTFRNGSRFRGLIEMAVAVAGTFYFCTLLFSAIGDRTEDISMVEAFQPYLPQLGLAVFFVVGSWVSGLLYAKTLFRR
jgi:hypothetical protein